MPGRYRKGIPKKVQKIARAIEKKGSSPGKAYRIAWATYKGSRRASRRK
jgi:hypothetical protein